MERVVLGCCNQKVTQLQAIPVNGNHMLLITSAMISSAVEGLLCG